MLDRPCTGLFALPFHPTFGDSRLGTVLACLADLIITINR